VGLPYQPKNWSGLSLAVGLSLAQSLGNGIQLKWPNDLWRQQRKLGGILIEAASQGGESYVVIGVGLNIQAPPDADLRTPAAAIHEFWLDATAPSVLARITQPLLETLKQFETSGFGPLQQAFNQLDALQQRHICTSEGLEGVCEGVDAEGALLIRTPHGLQAINSSEVSVRPT
jgi:BirA family biotin operon repressor/biotin-[acetyl-CoA-carboxylase] ligase